MVKQGSMNLKSEDMVRDKGGKLRKCFYGSFRCYLY